MLPIKQKIIQKRVQRKERFARMARIRYRKQTNVIAKSEIFADIEKSIDNSTLVHQYSPGIFFGERGGGIDCDTSMLNRNHLTNCITVIKEEDVQLVKIKLCKNTSKMGTPSTEDLENWKKRNHSEWTEWAERFKNFSVTYNNFLMKHQSKFASGRLDEEYEGRYNTFEELRKKVLVSSPCIEIKTRFNSEEDYVSEVLYNSSCITDLGYNLDEFVDKVLREGIPRLKCTENDNAFLMRHMMDNFEAMFEKTLEFKTEHQLRLMTNAQHLKTGDSTLLLTGYFHKKKAEISYLIVCNGLELIEGDQALVEALHMPVAKDEHLDLLERKSFIERFYRPPSPTSGYCGIREVDVLSTEGDDFTPKKNSQIAGIKEELVKDDPYFEEENENINNLTNVINYQPDVDEGAFDPCGMPDGSYNNFLQSYMFLFQNNLI